MTSIEQFAHQLAARACLPLAFDDLERLAVDPFGDVGRVPAAGNYAAAMQQLLVALPNVQEPFHLGRLIFFGAYLVEHGAPSDQIARLAAKRLGALLSAASEALSERPSVELIELARGAAASRPNVASALVCVDLPILGAMTLLCHDRAALRIARKDPNLLQSACALSEVVREAYSLAELLESSDEQALVVIHPAYAKGLLVTADGVRNGFHLFALLEGALLEHQRLDLIRYSAWLVEGLQIARGLRTVEREVVMRAHFDYHNFSAWNASGWVEDAPTRWIWGELRLHAIPRLDEHAILLIDKPRYHRSWDARLACGLHPYHRPSVTIERELEASEVTQWLSRCAAAPDSVRGRMRYAGASL